MPKQPIIFDFKAGRTYRASEADLADTVRAAATKKATGRIVRKTVEGIPPQVVTQPKT